MDKEKILTLVEKCIEKAASDFLKEKPVDYQALQTIHDSVRILHHTVQMNRQIKTLDRSEP